MIFSREESAIVVQEPIVVEIDSGDATAGIARRGADRSHECKSAETSGSQVSGQERAVKATVVVDLQGSWIGRSYAASVDGRERQVVVVDNHSGLVVGPATAVDRKTFLAAGIESIGPVDRLVLVLPARSTSVDERIIARCCTLVSEHEECRVAIVSSYRIHFRDTTAQHLEASVRRRFRRVAPDRHVVLRVGNVAAPVSSLSFLRRMTAAFYPLVADRFRSCYLDPSELFDTLEHVTRRAENAGTNQKGRVFTLLGANRATRDVWAERRPSGSIAAMLTVVALVLSVLQLGRAVGLIVALLARWFPTLRRLQFDTLAPRGVSELLHLYHAYNLRHVAIAGHNTGVTHFGWRYPGKTVLKTTGCGTRVRLHDDEVVVDAGVLLKRVVDELRRAGRQLYVVPNYSYISMGTTFFVPIHGSGSEVSTLGETIVSALVYDPTTDRIVTIKRGEPAFERSMYAPQSGVLVLRLRLRIRPLTRYFVRTSTLEQPSAAEVQRVFADPTAANIEVRKSQAASSSVQVSKYYTSASDDDQALEVPRDSIGRLWDRLEENPIASVLFHSFVRRFGFHVELFLDEREFAIFWAAHVNLPLSKIQLRFVRRDGLAQSPCGDRDCISADLFMRRSQRHSFLRFMKDELPHARFNPGKHSV